MTQRVLAACADNGQKPRARTYLSSPPSLHLPDFVRLEARSGGGQGATCKVSSGLTKPLKVFRLAHSPTVDGHKGDPALQVCLPLALWLVPPG